MEIQPPQDSPVAKALTTSFVVMVVFWLTYFIAWGLAALVDAYLFAGPL